MDSTGALSCPICKRLDFMRLIGTRAYGTAVHLEFHCRHCATKATLIIRQAEGITFPDGNTTEGYVYVEWEADFVPNHLSVPDVWLEDAKKLGY